MPSEKINNESFVSRWSRRKKEVVEEGIKPVIEVHESKQEEQVVNLEKRKQEKREKLNALTDEDMPDVETLGEESDYSGFMSINVSEELRKIALQKLFHGKSYNIRDGLDEYDGDYTSFKKLDPSIITADMKHRLEVEAKKRLAAEEEELLDTQTTAETDVVSVEQDPNEDQNKNSKLQNDNEKMIANQSNEAIEEEIDDDVEGEA